MSFGDLNIILVAVGGTLLILELTAGYLKYHLYLSEPIIAMCIGIIIGPAVLNLIDLNKYHSFNLVMEELARLTLAVTLMGVAFRIPRRFIFEHWRDILILILVALPVMWLVSGLLIYLILGIPFWLAFLIGAVISPTDPVLASTIVTSELAEKYIPAGLRHLISAESGLNDALAFPIIMYPLLVLTVKDGILSHFIFKIILWETIGAIIVGLFLGYLTAKILGWIQKKTEVEKPPLLSTTLALSFTALGLVKLIGSDGLLAVFASGAILSIIIHSNADEKSERIQEIIKRFIDLPIFIFFGMLIPWVKWTDYGFAAILLVAAILIFRRLPILLAIFPFVKLIKNYRDALFAGWFGPIGVAALYYSFYSWRQTNNETIWVITSMMIFASIIVHGITDGPFSKMYTRKIR